MVLSKAQQDDWENFGFILLEGFFESKRIDHINDMINHLWRVRRKLGEEYVIDIFLDTLHERRIYFADAPAKARLKPHKINDLYLSNSEIRELIVGKDLAIVLRDILEATPMVCNTLNLEFGSQQEYHFDTFYMPPPTPNKMLASWIALEDSTIDSGPLSYYPESHKIPPYHFSNGLTNIIKGEMPRFREYISTEIKKRNLKPVTLLAKKGDVFIWHSQLYHGGNKILNPKKTRKSLVTHYFTKEDFPKLSPPQVCEIGTYMTRSAQPVGYPYKVKNWIQRLLSF
jgi:ectoine hydroxylase-related dioxygenase (phytanoyl-CoA dioxygenase family)